VERYRAKVLKLTPIGVKIRRRRDGAEDGYVLVAVIFMMALLVLSLSVAVPRVRQDIHRDRELETLHRGKQYIRAVRVYYRKFHRYPPSIDALEKTNDIRFLRKRYIDPITGKDDWHPIQFGQNQVPIAMGFFGSAISFSSVAGTGPSGTTASGTNGSGLGSVSGFSGDGGDGFGSTMGNSTFGRSGNSTMGNSNFGTSGNYSNGNDGSSNSGTNGQTFGGAGIIGVSIPLDKQSLLRYKKQDHFNLWEFTFDPAMDLRASQLGSTAGTPSSSANGNSSGPPTGSGTAGNNSNGTNSNPSGTNGSQ